MRTRSTKNNSNNTLYMTESSERQTDTIDGIVNPIMHERRVQ